MSRKSFINAAAISMAGLFLVRFLSIIYAPLISMIIGGDSTPAGALNAATNAIFNPFYELSLAGLPMAVAKLISTYNARDDFDNSWRVYSLTSKVMMLLGVTVFAALFIFAEPLAAMALSSNQDGGVDISYAVAAVRLMSVSLLFIPLLSGLRGYLQGFKELLGVSVSQVIEQLVRIVVILVIAFGVTALMSGTVGHDTATTNGIMYSFIGIAISVVAGMVAIYPFYRKLRKGHRRSRTLQRRAGKLEVRSNGELLREVLSIAIPFTLANLAAQGYTMITTYTFNSSMIAAGYSVDAAQSFYQMYTFWTEKLVTIPLTFAMAFSMVLITFISSSLEQGKLKEVNRYILKCLQTVAFLTIAATIGINLLAGPMYMMFYGFGDSAAIPILVANSLRGLMFAFEVIIISILQGINRKWHALVLSVGGPLIKLALNHLLISLFGVYGDILATSIGLAFVVIAGFIVIVRATKFPVMQFIKSLLLVIINVAVMAVVIIAGEWLFNLLAPGFGTASRLNAFIYVFLFVIIGGGAYILFADWTGILQIFFGPEMSIKQIIRKITRRFRRS